MTSSKARGQSLPELLSQIPIPRSACRCFKKHPLLFLGRSLLARIYLWVLLLIPRNLSSVNASL